MHTCILSTCAARDRGFELRRIAMRIRCHSRLVLIPFEGPLVEGPLVGVAGVVVVVLLRLTADLAKGRRERDFSGDCRASRMPPAKNESCKGCRPEARGQGSSSNMQDICHPLGVSWIRHLSRNSKDKSFQGDFTLLTQTGLTQKNICRLGVFRWTMTY